MDQDLYIKQGGGDCRNWGLLSGVGPGLTWQLPVGQEGEEELTTGRGGGRVGKSGDQRAGEMEVGEGKGRIWWWWPLVGDWWWWSLVAGRGGLVHVGGVFVGFRVWVG
ncbi:hypothetical protein RND81_12G203800 [Saponaria officinalis]|uniref:Uncharacterized protein n=1 Tax=Saponaria officinalis TaxID=3572 RepID=A0AAW1HDB4_SAPOF